MGVDITPTQELAEWSRGRFIDVGDLIGGQAHALLESGKTVSETTEIWQSGNGVSGQSPALVRQAACRASPED